MRCLSKTFLTVLTVLFLLFFVQTVESSRVYYVTSSSQHFPTGSGYINFADSITPLTFTTFYKEGSSSKHHFNSSWLKTTVDLTVTKWSSQWFNYTASGGTQQIYEAKPKPNAVYFNGLSKTEGDGWSWSDQIITVTPSGTDVAITWGDVGGTSGSPSADSAGEGTRIPQKLNSTLIIISLTVLCLALLWLGETTKRRR